MKVRLPNNSQRTMVLGRTGTGKTVAALWHLSNYALDRSPWVLFDFKIDEHINSIKKAAHVDVGYIPAKKERGIFVVHPGHGDTTGKGQTGLEKYIWKLWERENVGIFCDETFMVGQGNPAFDACLTQGRSKRIPMIMCSQRPVWVSRFCFSEADFIQVFALNDARDKQTVESFMPIDLDEAGKLDDHQSWYYDIAKNALVRFNPVPNMDALRSRFDAKLPRRRVTI